MVTAASARMRSSADRARPRRRAAESTSPRMPASATSTFDPPPRIVTGTLAARASRQSRHDLVAVAGFDEAVGRPADAERRQRRQRDVATARGRRRRPARAAAAKSLTGALLDALMSARSCAISAAIASRRRAHHEGDRVAGPSCPASGDVGGDHGRDLRISAGGLPIGHQQDRHAPDAGTWRHAQRGRVGDDVGASRVRQRPAPSSRKPMRSESAADRVRRRLSTPSASGANVVRPAGRAARESRVRGRPAARWSASARARIGRIPGRVAERKPVAGDRARARRRRPCRATDVRRPAPERGRHGDTRRDTARYARAPRRRRRSAERDPAETMNGALRSVRPPSIATSNAAPATAIQPFGVGSNSGPPRVSPPAAPRRPRFRPAGSRAGADRVHRPG